MRQLLSGRRARGRIIRTVTVVSILGAVAALTATPASARPLHHFSPQVVHTGRPPTGYEVTFRYYDPTATTVQVRGEWFFSNAANTTTTSSLGLLPTQWSPGDFPIAFPNRGPAPNWPVAQMTRDGATGVWSYTTPLPSGTFTYGFYVNCASPPPALTGCTELSDPSNPPWNRSGSVEPDSEVYVPSDPRFGTPDLSWQAPNRRAHGALLDVSYPDSQSTNPVGSHPLAVYLPPGYKPHRRVPYPTLYLSHGGGGIEVDWSTQGAANSIVDNLIASGRAQPMVVVMTNFNNLGSCPIFDGSCYAQDVTQKVIPFVQAHFNVSHDSNDRAFAGLSLGGLMANFLLFNDTTVFGYFASWSITSLGAPATTSPQWQNPALKTRLGLQIGGGNFDSLTIPGINAYEADLGAAGIPFTDDRIDGGHEWYTWRQLLLDYTTTMAFRHTRTAVRLAGRHVAIATVAGDTTEPVPPFGTVQFMVNGRPAGHPQPLRFGSAVEPLPRLGAGDSVTVVYSGDNYYNSSTSEAVAAS